MSQEHSSKSNEDTIEIRDYWLDTDFGTVAQLLQDNGMFNPERDRHEHLVKLGQDIRMKVAVAMGERIVGSVYINNRGIPLVEAVVVHKDFRRRRIGTRLVRAAMEQLRQDGHKWIELLVDKHREDLMAWYESLGFRRDYHVVGMMQPIEPDPPRFEVPEITEIAFDHETVNQAFEDLYWKHRGRSDYFAPLEPDYHSPLTHEQLDEVKRLNPTRSGLQLRDAYERGWFPAPPIYGTDLYTLGWGKVDAIIKKSSIPMLRGAYFYAKAWDGMRPTPWVPLSSGGEGSEIEHVQCWFGRDTELAHPLEQKLDFKEAACLADAFHKVPNDTFLFLRQVKGIQHFGQPPSLKDIKPDGDFLCYDQANRNVFAFRLKGESTELLNPDETAVMLGDLVRYTKAYEMMAKGYRPSVR